MTDDLDRKLEIFLFGAGKGETIVLHLPDDRWGVVDCYGTTPGKCDTNPACRLLRSREVRELAFLCLTHPHDDHFRGMSQLLREFKVHAFWSSFGGLDPKDFDLLKTYFRADAEKANRPELRERAEELRAIFDLVERAGCRHDYVIAKIPLYPSRMGEAGDLRVFGLAPGPDQVRKYRKALLRGFKGGGFHGSIPEAHHNLASAGLRLEYGRTRVILGGDVEKESWEHVLGDHTGDLLAAHVVKVSHHGSTNGYCEALWAALARGGKTVAALTPYTRFKLPDPRAVKHIKSHAQATHSACLRPHPRAGSFRVRAAAALKTRGAPRVKDEEVGCCLITVDGRGNCQVIHQGRAGPL